MKKGLALLFALIFATSLIALLHDLAIASGTFESDVNCKLVMVNPNSNTVYTGTMPLNFTVNWSENGPVPWVTVQFSYSIDGNAWVNTTGGGYVDFMNSWTTYNTTTIDSVDISNLTSGLHSLTILAKGNYNLDDDFVIDYNHSFSPIYFSVNILSATPTPSASPTPSPTPSATPSPTPTSSLSTLATTADNGAIVTLAINGNVTSWQISGITISTNQSNTSTAIAFSLSGESGDTGFSNMTIPKSAVSYGTAPTIYIDGQPAQNQGYTQDASNYYAWYTTHFSTHQISIVFTTSTPTPTPTSSSGSQGTVFLGLGWVQLAILGVMSVVVVVVVVYAFMALSKKLKGSLNP